MKFSKHYKKLDWPIFTTIRQNKGWYKPGQTIKINTPKEEFKAEIISVQPINKKAISYDIAKFDAQTTKLDLICMLENWYGQKYDDFIVLTLINLKYSTVKPMEGE